MIDESEVIKRLDQRIDETKSRLAEVATLERQDAIDLTWTKAQIVDAQEKARLAAELAITLQIAVEGIKSKVNIGEGGARMAMIMMAAGGGLVGSIVSIILYSISKH